MLLPIVVAIFLSAWGLPQSYQSPPTEQTRIVVTPAPRNRTDSEQTVTKQQGESANPSQTPSSSSGVNQITASKNPETTERESRNVWQKAFAPETWTNWLLAVAGIVGIILALRSLKALREQIAAGKITAGAAQQSAEIAGSAAELAEKTLLLTERADILIANIDLSTGVNFNTSTVVKVTFKNYGRTRANNVVSKGWIVFGESREAVLALVDAEPNETIPASVPVVLGTESILQFEITPPVSQLNSEGIIAVNSGKMVIAFGVKVTYWDVFDKSHALRAYGVFNRPSGTFTIAKSHAT
jgi:hypothetical protein